MTVKNIMYNVPKTDLVLIVIETTTGHVSSFLKTRSSNRRSRCISGLAYERATITTDVRLSRDMHACNLDCLTACVSGWNRRTTDGRHSNNIDI